MQQGEGDDAAELKESPQDFALWKARKEGEDTAWPAPWGEGRPGWHIECSAMAEQLLGTDFEIHGGGSDLVFPHHENEIAQTEAARGQPLARIWMHNGMVRMGAEKMAKSVGNIRLLHQALEEFGRDALVMYFAARPLPPADRLLRRRRWRRPGGRSSGCASSAAGSTPTAPSRRASTRYAERFFDRLADDFNTPAARARAVRVGRARPTAASTTGERDGARAGWRRCCTRWASRACCEADGRGRRRRQAAARCWSEREAARAARDFERADAICATSWPRSARRCATPRTGARLRAPRSDRLRPQPRARGAAGRRAVRRVWATPAATEPRSGSRSEPEPPTADELERLCGSPEHQGVCAEAEPYPYADADVAARRATTRSSSASTRCRTRTTSAPSAGWPRRPARRAW